MYHYKNCTCKVLNRSLEFTNENLQYFKKKVFEISAFTVFLILTFRVISLCIVVITHSSCDVV